MWACVKDGPSIKICILSDIYITGQKRVLQRTFIMKYTDMHMKTDVMADTETGDLYNMNHEW
jgi:hypothetical protein